MIQWEYYTWTLATTAFSDSTKSSASTHNFDDADVDEHHGIDIEMCGKLVQDDINLK